jgi:uncharacterized protein YcbX
LGSAPLSAVMGHTVRMPSVAALTIAPVKALAGVRRHEVRLDWDGVADDRRLLLLGPDGSVVTQRRHPSLTAVVPDLDLSRGSLRVTFPDGTDATSELRPTGEPLHATLFGKARSGRPVAEAVSDALSDYVGESLRLLLADSVGVGWDEGPVSLVSTSSVMAVDAPAGERASAADRFRMMVVVDDAHAYEEDSWVGRNLQLGTATVRVSHRLGRCVVIDHSPVTGSKDWPGVRTIARTRGPDSVTLGVIAEVLRPGTVTVGDRLEVL